MTVAELIKKLSVMPLDAEVMLVYDDDCAENPLSKVELYSDRRNVVELA